MNILYIGFKGAHNSSYQLVQSISSSNKLLLTNSFNGIKKDLGNIGLESYDFIVMFGINKNLKNKIIIEVNSKYNNETLMTNVNYEKIESILKENNIDVDINDNPTQYLCNYAYHLALQRNLNSIFIHIPGISKFSDLNKLVSIFNKY